MKLVSVICGIVACLAVGIALIMSMALMESLDREVRALAWVAFFIVVGTGAGFLGTGLEMNLELKKVAPAPEEKAKQIAELEKKLAELKK